MNANKMANSGNARCHYCHGDLAAPTTVRLWDGRDYCETCVDSVLPGLAKYARENPVLKDSTAFSFSRLCQTMALSLPVGALLVPAIAVCSFGPFVPVESLMEYLSTLIGVFAVFYASALTLFFLFSPFVIVIAWSQYPRSITVENGAVLSRNYWGWTVARFLILPANLDEIQWSHGTTRGDHFVGWSWPRTRCLVIHTNIVQQFFCTGLTCGLTETMRLRWLAFFKLAGVRELGKGDDAKKYPNGDDSESAR